MSEEKKTFQVGNVVRFKDYEGEKIGTIVATRADYENAYLVVWRSPQEKWLTSDKLEIETIETLKRYEDGK